jgi:hypothetical protein
MAQGRILEGSDPETIWKQRAPGETLIVLARGEHNPLRFLIRKEADLNKQLKILETKNVSLLGCYAVR